MREVIVTKNVNATVDKVWNIVKTGDALNEWIPVIESCKLMESGAGVKRTCITKDGKTLEETIISVDEINKQIVYSIDKQDMMPITNIINKLRAFEIMNMTTIEWKAEFDMLDESMFPLVEQGLTGLFNSSIKGLEELAMKR